MTALQHPYFAWVGTVGELAFVPGRANPHAVFIAPRNVVFALWKMKAAIDDAFFFFFLFEGVSRIATAAAQFQ